jgi:hypothetical protein
MRLAGLVALGAASSVVGCEVFSLDGLAGGSDAGSSVTGPLDASVQDATEPDDARADAVVDAAADDLSVPPVDAGGGDAANDGGPVTLATVGSTGAPSGAAQRGHLAWTDGTQQWWLFYVDSTKPDLLQSVVSNDFVTWSQSTSVALPGAATDGRNVAVWAGAAGGQDVLHLSVSVDVSSTDRRHLHVRARPAGSALTFDPVVVVGTTSANLSGLDPDGPATALGTDGTIFETSGWFEYPDSGVTGNEYGWSSTRPDPGGAFTPAFGPATLVEEVPGYVNARGLVPLPGASASMLGLWESGDVDPDPTNVSAALGVAGSWSPASRVFAPASQDPNDWGACGNGATVSAVRHTSAGAWEHRVWGGSLDDGGSVAFESGAAMSALGTPAAAGAVVLCDGTRVHVFAIAPDAGSPIRTTVWDGTAWSAWSDAVAAGNTRTWLTGTITPAGRVALAWTESVGASSTIVGARVGP